METLLALYLDLKPVVDKLALRYECIRHYAQLVIKSQIPQVSRRAAKDRYLYLIAFIVYGEKRGSGKYSTLSLLNM